MPKYVSEKGFASVILVVLIMAIVGAAAYSIGVYLKAQNQVQLKIAEMVSTPTPQPTPNAKIYTDANLGFSFTYPASFEVIPDDEVKLC